MQRNDFFKRVKFLIEYDSSKSLDENYTMEQRYVPGVTTNPDEITPNPIWDGEEEPNYPSWCRYPDMAILPGKNKVGLSGEDALIKNYCYYPAPIPNTYEGKTTGIFIPQDAEIRFFDSEIINHNVKIFEKKYKETEDGLTKNFINIFPLGSVQSFKNLSGDTYIPRVQYVDEKRAWMFTGYFRTSDRKPYEQPSFVDTRNKYQKFIDEWGTVLQFSTFLISAVLSPFTEGTSMYLYIELMAEIGIGTAVAIRDAQKGDNIAAAFSILSAFLPYLKKTKWLTGISAEEISNLSKKMISSGLNESSSVRDYIRFYRGLEEGEQKVMTKLFKYDPYSRVKLSKEIISDVGKAVHQGMITEFKNLFKKYPKLYKDIDFIEKLPVRELGLNGVLFLVAITSEVVLGRKLNDTENENIKKIYQKIPESHKEEFLENLIYNSELIPSLLSEKSVDDFQTTINFNPDEAVQYWIEKNGGETIKK